MSTAKMASNVSHSAELLSPNFTSSVDFESNEKLQAKHAALMSLIAGKTIKIQKEIGSRNRKLRDLYQELNKTVTVLTEFKDVVWPPRKVAPVTPPKWMFDKDESIELNNDVGVSLDVSLVDHPPHSDEVNMNGEASENKMEKNIEVMEVEKEIEAGDSGGICESEAADGEEVNGKTIVEEEGEMTQTEVETSFEGKEEFVTNEDAADATISTQALSSNGTTSADTSVHPAVTTAVSSYCLVMKHSNRTPKMVEIALECTSLLIINHYISGQVLKKDSNSKDENGASMSDTNHFSEEGESVYDLHDLINSICGCADSTSDGVQTSMIKTLLALMTSHKCRVHEAAMLKAVRAAFHVYLVTKYNHTREVSKATLLDMLKSVFSRMESIEAIMRSESIDQAVVENETVTDATGGNEKNEVENGEERLSADAGAGGYENVSGFLSQFHIDGYLLFRALCKLSAKSLPGEATEKSDQNFSGASKLNVFSGMNLSVDPLAINSKVLSLELILSLFEHSGNAFQKGEKFIYAVQNYLCVSLLKNCMSNNTTVAHVSLKIFVLLVYKFKAHLKAEIEVFVSKIFLGVLESPNSSFEQKRLVLEALRALCSDPQILTQLFLNYDCDFDAINLYKTIVHHLTSLSVRPRAIQHSANKNASQDTSLSVAGLEVLVVILRAFLKALNLPGGDDNFEDTEPTLTKIRGSLQVNASLPAKSIEDGNDKLSVTNTIGTDGEEMTVSVKEVKDLERADPVNKMNGISSHSGNVAGKIVDAFDKKRISQQNFETGSVKFTLSFKQGLLFFIESGFFHLDAKEVSLFFHEHKDKLDKTQIGEVLGKEPESSFVKDEGADPEKGGEGFYVRILHHYVDAMDFTDLKFDDAMRQFLSGFRLPGEAQKIDRIMEKFAERYTRQNENVFPSADTAFILAFSVIMLQTDLHNPSIKPEKRMTVESFIRNNRGISVDGGDLPEAFLRGIFKRIQAQPFTLKEDDDARLAQNKASKTMSESSFFFETPAFLGGNMEERKRERFRKERAEMMEASEQIFKKRTTANTSQLAESVCPADVVQPMFEVTWGPLIGSLSQILEMADDDTSIALCLNGFVYSVRLSSHSGMSLARDTFVTSLAKFTTLGSIKEMKSKNIECIRTLLSIAIIDGEYLGESWKPVLQCISQLGRLHLFASGLASDGAFLGSEDSKSVTDSDAGGFFRQATKVEMARETEENNGRAVLEAINEVLIDKVFSSSVNLSGLGIVHFIDCLVAVSDDEIDGDLKKGISGVGLSSTFDSSHRSASIGSRSSSGHGGPRIFSLQRLVEVADYNMNVRPRLAWAQIWKMMAKYFAKMGSHENFMVSMFAIDALRQLSFKFLEKPELTDFNFQRIFLRPFLSVMENPRSREDIRELVLRCVDNMLRSTSHNLRSGWKIFFSILTLSASDLSEKISTLGLAILQRLLDEHLDDLFNPKRYNDNKLDDTTNAESGANKNMTAMQRTQRNASAEDFVELCRASLSFVKTGKSRNSLPIGLSMRALCHTACFADLISDGRVLPPVSGAQSNDQNAFGYTYSGLTDVEAEEMVLWRPLLDGLAGGICSTALSNSGGVGCLVQRGSVMTMRAILLRHGKRFSPLQWSVILNQVILPSIQTGAEHDESPVIRISSEAPAVSNIDFLSESLPLPPNSDDGGLIKFARAAQNDESAPSRPLGEAELLVEASFADLRHGGDGNLSRAHGLLKKSLENERRNIEQPFPDSWIATTAPIALGMLTDFFTEIFLKFGKKGRDFLWPIVMSQMEKWVIGYPAFDPTDPRSTGNDSSSNYWRPCEALVRIGCKEIFRSSQSLTEAIPELSHEDAKAWLELFCLKIANTISKNVDLENYLHKGLVDAKLKTLDFKEKASRKQVLNDEKTIITPYGDGVLLRQRVDKYVFDNGNKQSVDMFVIKLNSGATMYGPKMQKGASREDYPLKLKPIKENKLKKASFLNYLEVLVPSLKARCVASHCLQQGLPMLMNILATKAGQTQVSSLLQALEKSRTIACSAVLDEDVSNSFIEALRMEWDDGVEETESSFSISRGLNHRGRSEMFFLAQEAGANNAIIYLLSLLYSPDVNVSIDFCEDEQWKRADFAEPILIERMLDILGKFLISEEKDGQMLDPNVWRTGSESGGKVALYCTSFASVVIRVLNTILNLTMEQFSRHKSEFYPVLCALVKVQSDEIRKLVASIMIEKVAPLLDLTTS